MNTAYGFGSHEDENDNESDEGFVLNKVEVKNKNIEEIKTKLLQRPNDFLPRYVCGDGILRKEPQKIIETTIVEELPEQRHKQKESINKSMLGSIEKYSSEDYTVVYAKSAREKFWITQSCNEYSRNEINLSSVENYAPENYSVLKKKGEEKASEMVFDSRFESGNLAVALKGRGNEYVLFVQDDTNTRGYNRWFYFSVANAKPNIPYTFTVANLRKKCPFFSEGLSPVVFSLQRRTWTRPTFNQHTNKSRIDENYFSFTFNLEFEHANDTNFIAVGLPYSYSKLILFLKHLKQSHYHRVHFELQTIAYSLSNTQVPYLILTSKKLAHKANIVILARQHPGETHASFLLESMMNELLSGRPECEWLLDNYTFHIFPMVNVDGVIYGNFRCDLSGMDLNRRWKYPSRVLHPQLWAIQQEIERVHKQTPIVCCFDLHGHSKAYNVFAYCCKKDNQSCRVLPYMFSQAVPCFSFPACTFGLSRDKETTARAFISKAIKHFNVLTIESSFFGLKIADTKQIFIPTSFNSIANGLLSALKNYFAEDPQKTHAEQYLAEHLEELLVEKTLSQSGSDSDPECDEIPLKNKIGKIFPAFIAETVDEDELKVTKKSKKTTKLNSKQNFSQTKQTLHPRPTTYKREKIEKRTLELNISERKQLLQDKAREIEKSIDLRPLRQPRIASITIEHLSNKKGSIKIEKAKKETSSLQLQYEEPQKEKSKKTKEEYEFHFRMEKQEEEELPLLCVLSEKKKRAQLVKMKQAKESKNKTTCRFSLRFEPTLIIKQRIQHIEKLKEHQQENNVLISKIWRENFLKADESSSPRIFM